MVCFSIRGTGKGGHEKKKRESQAMKCVGVLGCLGWGRRGMSDALLFVVCDIFCVFLFDAIVFLC
jgi:hypothetical protein